MAESQLPFPYTPADIAALRASLSTPRFATYLIRAGNDEEYALALYLYNARLAKAFLYPLHVAEVTLRNAIDESLVALYGADWPYDNRFRTQVLTLDGLATLDKAILRVGGQHARKDDVVATLTFDFWSNLFRAEYHAFWRTRLNIILPHLPRGVTRHDMQLAVKEINQFRNRIAHHEPILDLNAIDVMSKIKTIVRHRCPTTEAWMRHHSTVAQALRTRPDAQGRVGVPLAYRQDQHLVRVTGAEALAVVMEQLAGDLRVVVRVDAAGAPTGVCTADDIMASIAAAAANMDGLVSVQELLISTVLGPPGPAPHWEILADDEPMARAVEILQQPQIRVLVGVDAASGAVTGAVARAHRRY
jgi:hypothetical protein